jgi:hypothetical protein
MRVNARMTRNTGVAIGPVGCLVVILAPLVAVAAFAEWAPGRIILIVLAAVLLSPLLLVILGLLVVAAGPLLLKIEKRQQGQRDHPAHR